MYAKDSWDAQRFTHIHTCMYICECSHSTALIHAYSQHHDKGCGMLPGKFLFPSVSLCDCFLHKSSVCNHSNIFQRAFANVWVNIRKPEICIVQRTHHSRRYHPPWGSHRRRRSSHLHRPGFQERTSSRADGWDKTMESGTCAAWPKMTEQDTHTRWEIFGVTAKSKS